MLTVRETAELLNLSNPRVYQLIREGKLRAEKFGNAWVIDKKSVRERLSQENRPGRPELFPKERQRKYTLMNREYEILDFEYDIEKKQFSWSGDIKDKDRAPIGIVSPRGRTASTVNLQSWWKGRAIPAERPGIQERLHTLGYTETYDPAFDSLGFSLSDQYWIKPSGSNLNWHDLNYFENDFEMGSDKSDMLSSVGLKNPDNTSDGCLPKKWICDYEDRVLLKGGSSLGQEPFNEKIASELFSMFLEKREYVEYRIEEHGGKRLSACSCFINSNEEYVPAWHIIEAKKKPNHLNYYQHYINCCAELGVEDIAESLEKMIVLDFAIMNFDRHYRNFGLIRNVEDLTWRVAPLFDTGNSLLCDVSFYDLERHLFKFTSKPFYEDPKRQLRLASDLSWLDCDKFDGLEQIIEEVLSSDDVLSQRIPYITQEVARQIEFIKSR